MAKYSKFDVEKYFMETLERITKNRFEYKVLYINISKLKPKNRHPKFVKIITRLFDNLVSISDSNMFVLSNGDFAILGKNITEKTVNDAIDKLRRSLITDPIWTARSSNEFTKVYNPEEFDELYQKIGMMINNEDYLAETIYRNPIDASQIDAIKDHLDFVNIVDIVKHQSIIRLENAGGFRRIFDEFFVAVKDLNQNFDKNVDLFGNKWLFMYLTQSLDKKTISAIGVSDAGKNLKKISLNLNLSTMKTAEFNVFEQHIRNQNKSIIVEVQPMDVLNNMEEFFNIKEMLHRLGHEILLDATSLEMLNTLDVTSLGFDYIKLFWHDFMDEYSDQSDSVKGLFESIGYNKLILAKCMDEKSVHWGIRNGIRAFQGPYIDKLEVAIIKKNCPNGKKCSAEDCLKRKKMISGYFRNMCEYKDILERKLG